MIYLSIFVFVLFNFYYSDKLISNNDRVAFFISVIPSFFLLTLLPSLQGGVGADYYSYIDIYNGNVDELNRFFYRGEYGFYYILKYLSDFNAGEQTVFVISSTINMLFLFYYFCYFRKYNYNVCFFFLCFFLVTNIYHNQMNGIRQYIALMMFPGVFILICNKRYFTSLLFIVLASFFHFTALVAFLLYPAIYISKLSKKLQFIIFILLSFSMFYVGEIIEYIVNSFFGFYAHYLESDYGEGLSFSSILSKLYYLPVFFVFWWLYLNDRENGDPPYIRQGISVWLFTYWMFLLYLSFGFSYRISAYFFFFYIFPLCYIFRFFYANKKYVSLLFLVFYLFIPYFLKVVAFPKGVFTYKSFLF